MRKFLKKFKKPILIIAGIALLFVLLSQTGLGKRLNFPQGFSDALMSFLKTEGENLSAADYKEGTILLIKPVTTGVGEGRYEAGDVVEIRDGEELYRRFGEGNFLGSEERTRLLPVYYPGKLSEEQKNELLASETEQNSNDEGSEKILKRRQEGIDYTQFLSDREIVKVRQFGQLSKIPEIDLSAIIKKQPEQVSTIRVSKKIQIAEKIIRFAKRLARSLLPPAIAQAPETVKIVDPGNGPDTDYTSLNSWEGSMQDDLVSTSTPYISVAKCRTTNSASDATAVSISGWTTDATHYIKIWTDPSESYRHSGKWDDTKYRLEVTAPSNGSTALSINDEYARIFGLQVYLDEATGSKSGGSAFYVTGSETSLEIQAAQNIFRQNRGSGDSYIVNDTMPQEAGVILKFWNNVLYGGAYRTTVGTARLQRWHPTYVYNNTLIGPGSLGNGWHIDSTSNLHYFNNIAQGFADGWYGDSPSETYMDYNLSDVAADAPGSHSRNGVTLNFADAANNDFHLASGDTGAKDWGTNLSEDPNLPFSDDIDGQNRPIGPAWDIGADETRTTMINTPLSSRFIDSSLVGYWSFDGADIDWGSNTAYDLSGNGNNGTITNMSTTSSPAIGINGQALDFDGSDDYVLLSSNPLSSMSQSSASVWVKLDNLRVGSGGYGQTFLNLYTDTENRLRMGHDETSSGRIFISYTSGGSTYGRQTNGGVITANTWYHIAYTFDGSTLNIYVNGVDSDTGSNTFAPGAVNVIGTRNFTSGATDGLIDEVRIYNRALSAEEIAEQYRAGAARLTVNTPMTQTLTSGLVGYWTFNGADIDWGSNTAYDLSGNGNNGTITNMSTTSSPAIGINGQALEFDGTNDYISTPYTPSSFTVSVWVKPNVVANSRRIWSSGSGEAELLFWNGRYNLYGDGYDIYPAAAPAVAGVWAHVVSVVQQGVKAELYFNGNLVGSDNTIGTATQSNLEIGRKWGDSVTCSTCVSGVIDEPRIYNRALSVSEIQQLYRLGAARMKMVQ